MKRGTKSILFGVHNFLWHPFTVWRAWRYLYKKNPTWVELVAIFCHDLGYWGKPDMDGVEGRTHPEAGAEIAGQIAFRIGLFYGVYKQIFGRWRPHNTFKHATFREQEARGLCLGHSTHYANGKVSALYLPDKVCILFDPPWFYKLRAWLSGELAEYVDRENHARWIFGQDILTTDQWLTEYRVKVQKKADEYLRGIREAGHRDFFRKLRLE